MHGKAIALEDGTSAQLLAGYRHDILELKVQIEFNDAPSNWKTTVTRGSWLRPTTT
jgi:hypothetical protein